MKKLSYFVFGFSLFLTAISIFLFIFFNKPIEMQNFYANVTITSGDVGVDLNNTALTYGKVHSGGSSVRFISVSNDNPYPIIVKVSAEGDITPLLLFDKITIIKSGESVSIPVSANIPSDYPSASYDGNVKFKILKAFDKL